MSFNGEEARAAAESAAARFMDEARTIMRAVQGGALESGEEQVQAVRSPMAPDRAATRARQLTPRTRRRR